MEIPECNKNCAAHFHMTGGRHLKICDLYKFDEIASWLDLARTYICTGNGLFDQEFVDMLNRKLKPFICDTEM